jgi:hypothetical protein
MYKLLVSASIARDEEAAKKTNEEIHNTNEANTEDLERTAKTVASIVDAAKRKDEVNVEVAQKDAQILDLYLQTVGLSNKRSESLEQVSSMTPGLILGSSTPSLIALCICRRVWPLNSLLH